MEVKEFQFLSSPAPHHLRAGESALRGMSLHPLEPAFSLRGGEESDMEEGIERKGSGLEPRWMGIEAWKRRGAERRGSRGGVVQCLKKGRGGERRGRVEMWVAERSERDGKSR